MKLLKKLSFSLSARLLLLFVITGILIWIIISATLRFAVSHQFESVIQPHLIQYLEYIQRDLGNPPDLAVAENLSRRLPVDITIRGPGVNWSTAPQTSPLPELKFHTMQGTDGFRYAVSRHHERFLLKTHSGDYEITFEIRRKTAHWQESIIGLLALAALIGVLYLNYRAIRWLFQPVQQIQAGVQRIGAGELDARIQTRRSDELGVLAASINAMADDIQKMLEAKRELLLAISHELRSPITRARVSTELVEAAEVRNALRHDLREMESLIEELLETERLNSRHVVLNKSHHAIQQLAREVLEEQFPLANIECHFPEKKETVFVDASRIKLLLKNLLENAIRYTPEGGPPVILEIQMKELLEITVQNTGPGIAAEHIANLTEPFYRADPSRQRKTGGYGLGLYLCRIIAEAHGGRITIESEQGLGTTVRVLINPR